MINKTHEEWPKSDQRLKSEQRFHDKVAARITVTPGRGGMGGLRSADMAERAKDIANHD